MKIADQLYAYIWRNYQANNCNTFIIQTDQTTCLIDPGLKSFLPQLVRLMEQDGIRADDVHSVILTHCHPDHMEGASVFQEMGARVGIHKDDERFIKEVGPSFAAMLGMQMPDIAFDFYLDEGDLQIGEEPFKVLHTPGHSPGEIVLFWEKTGVLFSGDLVFPQGVGRTDFPGGDSAKLKEGIQRCSRLNATMLLPGHGEPILNAQEVTDNFEMIERLYFDHL